MTHRHLKTDSARCSAAATPNQHGHHSEANNMPTTHYPQQHRTHTLADGYSTASTSAHKRGGQKDGGANLQS
jgi:hypothetical protein